MSLNCPHCDNKFKFFDLLLFRIHHYEVECKNCNKNFTINPVEDIIGLIILLLIVFSFIPIAAGIFKISGDYLSDIARIIILLFMLIAGSLVLIWGQPYYFVWLIKKKYNQKKN